jgi:hypothetical protein
MKPPREGINWWPLYILLLVICGVVAWKGFSMGGHAIAGVMFFVPIFGWVGARLIIHGAEYVGDAKRKAEWADLNGIHYAYGPHELRAIEFDNALWFYESDILQAANIRTNTLTQLFPSSERRPLEDAKSFVLNEAGIEHLLMKHPDAEAKRFLMFLRREAYFPWKRAHGQKVEAPTAR